MSEVAKSRRKPRTLKGVTRHIRSQIALLKEGDCSFWACEGPDAPPEHMMTCSRCWAIHGLREAIEDLAALAKAEGKG
jgi:hypothetical protein